MKTKLLATVLLLASLSPAFAQDAPPAMTTSPADAQSGMYTVESKHTEVLFSVMHMGFTDYYGEFSGVSGSLNYDAANPAASKLEIQIPVDTLHVASVKLQEELQGQDWLNQPADADMSFRSTGLTVTGANTGTMTGNLTLHGVTKPVTLTVKFNGAGPNPMSKKYTLGFSATGTLKRSDFGVSKYVPMVSDDVDLIISAAFEKE
jgi:polyisoprenoid-binding protein YceI